MEFNTASDLYRAASHMHPKLEDTVPVFGALAYVHLPATQGLEGPTKKGLL